MLKSFCAIAVIVLLSASGGVHAGDAKPKKTLLEGSWKAVDGKQEVKRATFTGNNFEITFGEDRTFKGTFKLRDEKDPWWLDLTIKEGPGDYKGKTTLGIVKIQDGKLTWCASKPGRKRRPLQFAKAMGDAKLLLVTLEKKRTKSKKQTQRTPTDQQANPRRMGITSVNRFRNIHIRIKENLHEPYRRLRIASSIAVWSSPRSWACRRAISVSFRNAASVRSASRWSKSSRHEFKPKSLMAQNHAKTRRQF